MTVGTKVKVKVPLCDCWDEGQGPPAGVTDSLLPVWSFSHGQTEKLNQHQAPGVIGSALGLVGPVLISCDWMR